MPAEREDGRMTQPAAHSCPYCALRFLLHNEVKDHIAHDHPQHAKVATSAEIHEMPPG